MFLMLEGKLAMYCCLREKCLILCHFLYFIMNFFSAIGCNSECFYSDSWL